MRSIGGILPPSPCARWGNREPGVLPGSLPIGQGSALARMWWVSTFEDCASTPRPAACPRMPDTPIDAGVLPAALVAVRMWVGFVLGGPPGRRMARPPAASCGLTGRAMDDRSAGVHAGGAPSSDNLHDQCAITAVPRREWRVDEQSSNANPVTSALAARWSRASAPGSLRPNMLTTSRGCARVLVHACASTPRPAACPRMPDTPIDAGILPATLVAFRMWVGFVLGGPPGRRMARPPAASCGLTGRAMDDRSAGVLAGGAPTSDNLHDLRAIDCRATA